MMKYGVNLNMVIEKNSYVPVTAAWSVIDSLMEVMCRTYKNIPVIVGARGIDKSMLAEGIAYRILKGESNDVLAGHYVIHVMTDLIIAASKDINELVISMRALLEEAEQYSNIILYFDELYPEFYSSGNIDLPTLLKPMLKKGNVKIFGSSERNGLQLIIDKDHYIRSRIDIVKLKGFSDEKVIGILERFAARIENDHNISISRYAVKHTHERVKDFLVHGDTMEKTMDILDMAATKRMLDFTGEGKPSLRVADIDYVTASIAGIPLWRVCGDIEEYGKIEERLASNVSGQKESIVQIADVIRAKENRFNLDPNLPNGVFLFVGRAE